jgi:hypothetical protein
MVPQGLGLHDALHVGGPSVLAGDQRAGRLAESLSDLNLLDLVSEDFLAELAESLEGGLLFLETLLLVLGVIELEAFFGGVLELVAVEVLQLLDDVFIDGVDHVDDFEVTLLEGLNEGGGGGSSAGLSSDDVDVLLTLLHPSDVFLETDELLSGLVGVVAEELAELLSVAGVLVDAQLEVLAELLVELLEVLGVLGDLLEELHALLSDVLLDHLQDLVVLQVLTGDVEGEIFGVDDTADEAEVLGDEILAVVHDEDSADVELDVVFLLLGLEHVEGGALGDEDDGLELESALHGELLDSEVVLPVVGEGLVEVGVVFLGDLVGLLHPDGLGLVELLELSGDLFDLLLLLVLLLLGNLDTLLLLLLIVLIVGDLLLGGLLNLQGDGEGDELGVLLHQVLQLSLLEEFHVVGLDGQDDLGAANEGLAVVLNDGEGSSGGGLPTPLLVVLGGFRDDGDLIGDKEGGVETHTELSDHGDVSSLGEGLHEGLGAGLGDGSEVGDEFLLGHANAGVAEGEGVVVLVGDDVDLEDLLLSDDIGVGE